MTDKPNSRDYEPVATATGDLESTPLNFPHLTTTSPSDFGYYTPRYTFQIALQSSIFITSALIVADYLIYTKCNEDGDYPLQNPNVATIFMRWANVVAGQYFTMRSFVLLRSQSREGHSYWIICLYALIGLMFTMAAILVQFQDVLGSD